MNIDITNAYANNLKNISLSIPLDCITGLTGVSGSGKSSLLKNTLAAYGALNFSRLKTKTVQNFLVVEDIVDVDEIKNLPQTLFIDIVNHVTNTASTLSTISGIHDLLREIFTHAATTYCRYCGSEIQNIFFQNFSKNVEYISIDVFYNKDYNEKLALAASLGKVIKEIFYDKTGSLAKTSRSRAFATILVATAALSEQRFRELSRLLDATILAKVQNIDEPIDPLLQVSCPTCRHISPRLNKSRFSFNVNYDEGGGKCTCCHGAGKIVKIDPNLLIADEDRPILQGGIHFVGETGIKYTTVTEVFISAFCAQHGIDTNAPVGGLTQDKLDMLLQGAANDVHFHDRVGGKKTLPFEGVANYLIANSSKKGPQKALSPFISKIPCTHCENTRIDPSIDSFRLQGVVLRDLLKMSLHELQNWVREFLEKDEAKVISNYLRKLEGRLSSYEKVSCSHLRLNRSSATLSGGELQRIRLCSIFNSNIRNICYLLDEPSSGLHYQDIDKISLLFQEIRDKGNTLIFVEHNKKLLTSCDYIVELGAGSGSEGGEVVLADYSQNINSYQTLTARYLSGNMTLASTDQQVQFADTMSFTNISYNNLKNVSVEIPYNAFTVVCGISGSGKSSFIKTVFNNVQQNSAAYGFRDVFFLKQRGIQTNKATNVGMLLKIMDPIAKFYETQTGINRKYFLPSTKTGMCQYCKGTGFLMDSAISHSDICPHCEGRCYDPATLDHRLNGLNIHDILNIPLSKLSEVLPDAETAKTSNICTRLGIGYLTLERKTKSLSKGEYQRVLIARYLTRNEKNTLCLLDEPSKGLHPDDIEKMMEVIHQFTSKNNTIIAVEHNPAVIYRSDYAVEFGPGSGDQGGEVVYSGRPNHISGTSTAQAVFEVHGQCKFPSQTRKSAKNSNFSINREGIQTNFRQYSINNVSHNSDDILKACKKTEGIFLDAAIPNRTALFDKASEDSFDLNVPLMFLIDFANEKIRTETSVYNALNISTPIIKGFTCPSQQKSKLLSSVFNDKSAIGKCLRCRGKGEHFSLPHQLFMDGADLSRSCIRFLANSTNFKKVKKVLKKITGLDIGKPLSQMTNEERLLFLYGHDALLKMDDNTYEEWKGLIENAVFNYKYYPDPQKNSLLTEQKVKIGCLFCKGKLLERKYADYTFCGLTFSEWLTRPAREIMHSLSHGPESRFKDDILNKMDLLHQLCTEDIRLIDSVGKFSSSTQGLLKLLSLFVNNIYGTVIVIKNTMILSSIQNEMIQKISKTWSESNTIVQIH